MSLPAFCVLSNCCVPHVDSKLWCENRLLNSCGFDSVIALRIFQHDTRVVIKLVLVFRAFPGLAYFPFAVYQYLLLEAGTYLYFANDAVKWHADKFHK